ncbi:lytic transglycosylase domain-containing protein [Desulfonema magnum]|uniref:Lytic transglycosylase family protein n=1 Tax=Desulfonema magnum TaxID=45655 RepID=A0A975GKY4_9BACT|nr:lytic transglycosylase domain-containing protein [Desulfonema magnum]QTA85005.1 Lytic transglycosylase family protein [Desulfonema magnum]
MLRNVLLFFCIVFMAGITADRTEAFEPSRFPSLISSIKISPPVDFCGEPVPLDDPLVYEGLEKELLLFLWRRSQVILWLKRTGRYMPYLEKMLKKNGLPDDLKYSAVVESSLLPHIRSSKYATGLWQFIKSTGIRYGLRIDSKIDERRNIYKATEAATKYLRKLYGDFGSWTLAVAAYNMGEAGLKSRIKFQKTDDFYHLYLPLETQQHLLRIVAVKLILSDPEKYGFHFRKEDFYSPLKFDTVRIDCSEEVPLPIIADASKTYYKTIRDMNPEIRDRKLGKGTYSLAVPKGAAKGFQARFKRLFNEYLAEKKENKPKVVKHTKKRKKIYVVRRGDSLSNIAAKFNVPMSKILRWNQLRHKNHIVPGQRLIIRP